jgi:hypothetical protein
MIFIEALISIVIAAEFLFSLLILICDLRTCFDSHHDRIRVYFLISILIPLLTSTIWLLKTLFRIDIKFLLLIDA